MRFVPNNLGNLTQVEEAVQSLMAFQSTKANLSDKQAL